MVAELYDLLSLAYGNLRLERLGNFLGMEGKGSASSASAGYNATRDNFMPAFSGRPGDYREWRKRINLYNKKMVLLKREKETSSVASLDPHRKLSSASTTTPSRARQRSILKLLDKSFQYSSGNTVSPF